MALKLKVKRFFIALLPGNKFDLFMAQIWLDRKEYQKYIEFKDKSK